MKHIFVSATLWIPARWRRLLIFAVIIICVSCTELNLTGNGLSETESFFQSEQDFLSFIGSAYASLAQLPANNSLMALQEVTTDEICVPRRGDDWYDGGHWQRMHTHQWTPDDPIINSAWQSLYSGINECNRFLASLEVINSPVVPSIRAELRGLRALFYLWLLDTYGNIPILRSYTQDYTLLTNSSRAEVFDFIEAEFVDILPELQKPDDQRLYSRVHVYTARTALAKLYLNAVIYQGDQKWEQTLSQCDEIINSGVYSLEGDYFDNFNSSNEASPEIIFAIPHDEQLGTQFNVHMMTLHPESQKTYNLISQPWNGWCALKDFVESYDDKDLRKGQGSYPGSFLYGLQLSSGGDTLYDVNAEVGDPDGSAIYFTKDIRALQNAYRQDGTRIGKFEIPIGSGLGLPNDFPVFRFADILLMKAEALWRLERDSEALILINQIRDRAGLENLLQIDADIILVERGRELFYEMHRRTDLIRFGQFTNPWWEKDKSEECKILFPIPRNILSGGIILNQNPCY